MSRHRRPYCPRLAFHITTRLTGHVHLWDVARRSDIVDIISESSTRSDAVIGAFAIMENHLHLLVRQGEDPLSSLMQPALRRVGAMVKRHFGIQGHVFERRFTATPCLSSLHVRNAIVYAHLNPVRAGLCAQASDADSTSHHDYAVSAGYRKPTPFITPLLELFAGDPRSTQAEWRQSYEACLAYRRRCDLAGNEDPEGLLAPPCGGGDNYFGRHFAVAFGAPRHEPYRPDLRDIALQMLGADYPDVTMQMLRGSYIRSRQLQAARKEIMRRAASAGYSGVAIASFFHVSYGRVSQVVRRASAA
jgi:REP element-mobilizing transposase RayT